jgi:hypothetical protein
MLKLSGTCFFVGIFLLINSIVSGQDTIFKISGERIPAYIRNVSKNSIRFKTTKGDSLVLEKPFVRSIRYANGNFEIFNEGHYLTPPYNITRKRSRYFYEERILTREGLYELIESYPHLVLQEGMKADYIALERNHKWRKITGVISIPLTIAVQVLPFIDGFDHYGTYYYGSNYYGPYFYNPGLFFAVSSVVIGSCLTANIIFNYRYFKKKDKIVRILNSPLISFWESKPGASRCTA